MLIAEQVLRRIEYLHSKVRRLRFGSEDLSGFVAQIQHILNNETIRKAVLTSIALSGHCPPRHQTREFHVWHQEQSLILSFGCLETGSLSTEEG